MGRFTASLVENRVKQPVGLFLCLKKAKNGTLAKQTLGAIYLNLSMHTQVVSGCNMD